MLTRRSVLFGLLAAPIVVRSGLVMPIKAPSFDLAANRTKLDLARAAIAAQFPCDGGRYAGQFMREVMAQFEARQSLLRFAA